MSDEHLIPLNSPLQDAWLKGTCYGCGPNNPQGLQLKSFWSETEDAAICTFQGKPYHNAGFENVMYGGLVASLCDCHSIWAAIAATYRQEGRVHGSLPAISYVTGNLNVSFLHPTPLSHPIILKAKVEEIKGRKASIYTVVLSDDRITAEAKVVAVRVLSDKSVGAVMGG